MLELLASDYRSLVQDLFAITICVAALIWGGWPERAVALTWLIVFEFGRFLYRDLLGFSTVQLLGVDSFLISSDLIAGVAWIVIALYANRNYTLWIAGLQILAICAHLARFMSDQVAPLTYLVMIVAPGWLQLSLLATGLVRHINRKRIYGPYRDWRTSFSGVQSQYAVREPQALNAWIKAPGQTWRDDLK